MSGFLFLDDYVFDFGPGAGAELDPVSQHTLTLLRELDTDPMNAAVLRRTQYAAWPLSLPHRMRRDALHQQVARRLYDEELALRPAIPHRSNGSARPRPSAPAPARPTPAPASPAPSTPPEPAPSASEPGTQWLSVQVVDDATGLPLAGVPLDLALPDGTVRTVRTDAAGWVNASALPEGTWQLQDTHDIQEIIALAAV